MDTDEALDLRKYDRIRVRRAGATKFRLALVAGDPEFSAGRALLPFVYAKGVAGAETMSSREHIAVVGIDEVEPA